jgi:hypothetical protein
MYSIDFSHLNNDRNYDLDYKKTIKNLSFSYNSKKILKTSSYLRKTYFTNNSYRNFLKHRLPIIEWFPKYNIKQNLLRDIIGGITVT